MKGKGPYPQSLRPGSVLAEEASHQCQDEQGHQGPGSGVQQRHPETDFREESVPIGESGLEGEGLDRGIGGKAAVDTDQDRGPDRPE